MIEYAGAIFLVIGFIFILKIAKLVEKSSRVIEISKRAVAELRSTEMSDDAKESAMQSHAKQLLGLFFLITIGGVAAVFLPFAVILGLNSLDLISVDAVLEVALSWPFLVATTAIIVIALMVQRKK